MEQKYATVSKETLEIIKNTEQKIAALGNPIVLVAYENQK